MSGTLHIATTPWSWSALSDAEALCQDWGLPDCSIFTRDRAGCVHSCTTPGTDCYPVGASALYRYDAVAGRWVCGPP